MNLTKLENKLLKQPCYKIGRYFLSITSIKKMIEDRDIAKNYNMLNSWYVAKADEFDTCKEYICNALFRHKDAATLSRDELIDKVIRSIQKNNRLPDNEKQKAMDLCKEYIELKTGIVFETEKEILEVDNQPATNNVLTMRW